MATKNTARNTSKGLAALAGEGHTEASAPSTEKPARKARSTPPIRKIAESASGHFADSLTAVVTRLLKIRKLTAKWPAQNEAAGPGGHSLDAKSVTAVDALRSYAASFQALAETGFAFKMSFPRGPKTAFVVGQKVSISAEGLELLHKDFPSLTADHDVRVAPTLKDGDKAIPLMLKYEGNPDLFLGRVSYKFLNRATAAE